MIAGVNLHKDYLQTAVMNEKDHLKEIGRLFDENINEENDITSTISKDLIQSKPVSWILRESNSIGTEKIRWLVEEKLLIVNKTRIIEAKKSSLFLTTWKST